MSAEWSVRVRAEKGEATVTAGKQSWRVGPSLSLGDTATAPTALQSFLGVLAADLGTTFRSIAEKRRILVDEVEVLAKAKLHNPLVALGVIGEEGSSACSEIHLTLFVAANADTTLLEDVWRESQVRAPVIATLATTQLLNLEWRPI